MQTLLGTLLVLLVGMATISALAALVLIECAWIVRLGGRLYESCRSLMKSIRETAQQPYELEGKKQAAGTGSERVERDPNSEGMSC
jgi:hypothetical protein